MDLRDRAALVTGATSGLGAAIARALALREKAALKRATDINDVARQVVLFCQAESVTGQTLVIDGGIVFQ